MFIFSIFWCFICKAGFADASAEMSLKVSSRYHIISAIPSHCHHHVIISSFIMSSYHRSSCHHRTLISHCRLSQCVVSFSHLQRALIQSPGKTRWCQVEHGSSFLHSMAFRQTWIIATTSNASQASLWITRHLPDVISKRRISFPSNFPQLFQ